MNLFDLIIVRTARNLTETTVTSWDCDETHHFVDDNARLQVRFATETADLMVNVHNPETDEYAPSLRLVGARLVRADEHGVTYAGFTTGDHKRLACEVVLTRDDIWHLRQPLSIEWGVITDDRGSTDTYPDPETAQAAAAAGERLVKITTAEYEPRPARTKQTANPGNDTDHVTSSR